MNADFSYKDTLLYVEDVSVAYGQNIIIQNINFTEKDVVRKNFDSTGQVIAFVGRSGRGKSTLFKALTGLVPLHSGRVLIKDFASIEENAAKEVVEGTIGFVDQKYTLFRHKTVRQSFDFALRKSGLSPKDKTDKINQFIEKWGLETCAEKYPNELSGGQRQRTAIIEQLFSSDQFIILDEPFSGLDVGNILEVKRSFEMLGQTSEFNTIIFSTHDIELAIDLAQVIYVIGHPTIGGELQKYGTIVGKYDLREEGLAWEPYGAKHLELQKEVVNAMMLS